jgi:hypothetical protein
LPDRDDALFRSRALARGSGTALALFTLGFSICMVIAALLYPGGTWCNPQAPHYQVLESFFCDVLHERGLNGDPNPGAPWARTALVLIALGFVPFWSSVPSTMALSVRRAAIVRALGWLSAAASLAVALSPSDRWPSLHQVAVLSAAASGIAAAVIASTSRVTGAVTGTAPGSRARRLRLLAWGALTTAAIDAGLYLSQALNPQPCAVALPLLQKVAAIFVLGWMLGTALATFRGPAPAPPGGTPPLRGERSNR